MEGLASAFSGFPGFSPMMMMNRSETCATRRLCQCTGFGISMNDVTQKFNRNPEYATDLSRMDFFARKAVIEQVEKWRDENENKPELIHENKWTPILYICEIVKSSPKHDRDWGHLVFTDATLSRFLIIMIFPSTCDCGNLSHHDYDAGEGRVTTRRKLMPNTAKQVWNLRSVPRSPYYNALTRYHADRFMSLVTYLKLE
uniref:Uncharacterized protein n=1 Tax=Moniliophthora roreri TaxID=221103 RepID=A0A0W0F0W3_MONRR